MEKRFVLVGWLMVAMRDVEITVTGESIGMMTKQREIESMELGS